ncbi:phosphotransferase [Pseudomaricurvus sp. HS19]|uniref:phosphotransferase n=1 Tax=Pseudomaricurvus sp. HS19 TaxID=2692626 RepID=UPI00136DFD20|nr:phosphotransferase [Pseudomaricurvus sp. HS19]MYM63444.1 phosphotransferase [Pseudomaricurvus sp. HS19]
MMNQHWHSGTSVAQSACRDGGAGGVQPAAPLPLLRSAAELSQAWVQRALCFYDNTLPPVSVMQQQRLAAGIDNATAGSSTLLQLQFSGNAGQPMMMLLRIAEDQAQEGLAEGDWLHSERELAAYQELHQHHSCRVPRVVFSIARDRLRNTFLQYDGGLPGSYVVAARNDLAQVRAVLRELAGLHGCFIGASPAAAPEWLLRLRSVAEDAETKYQRGLQVLLAPAARHWQQDEIELLQQLQPLVAAWHCYERHTLTFSHGAASVDSALLLQQGDKFHAALINWQRCGLRNPMYDVASLLLRSLEGSVRRRNERLLLDEYRRLFEQAGRHYSLEELEQDYRFNLCGPLIDAVIAAGEGAGAPDDGALELIGRCLQAVSDWRSVALAAARLQQARPR